MENIPNNAIMSFTAGYRAGREGFGINQCPYLSADTAGERQQRTWWLAGFDAGHDDITWTRKLRSSPEGLERDDLQD